MASVNVSWTPDGSVAGNIGGAAAGLTQWCMDRIDGQHSRQGTWDIIVSLAIPVKTRL